MKTYYIGLVGLILIGLFLIGVGVSTFVTHQFLGYGVFIGIVGVWMLFDAVKSYRRFKRIV